MTKDDFGFGATRKSREAKIAAFSPRKESRDTELRDVDRVGDALGFVPREPSRSIPARRRKEIGPTIAINMRVPEAVAETFITYCEENRFSYWEGVADLMRKSGLL